MPRPIWVGMSEQTAQLHVQVFGWAARLPELRPSTRQRAMLMAADYAALLGDQGMVLTIAHRHDRLAVVDFERLGLALPEHLKEFYAARANFSKGRW
jgi:hypothetical protein